MIKSGNSKFLKVVCSRCKNRQIIFGKSSMQVRCFRCNKILSKTQGGKTRILSAVKEVF